jgi:hypothetical protein
MNERQIRRSALEFTFRLPPPITQLIARLYRRDEIQLRGVPRPPAEAPSAGAEVGWAATWENDTGLYLVVHDEHGSRNSNETEVEIIRAVLTAGADLRPNSVAVVTPHRAQRSLLRQRLADFGGAVDVIDTVERLQGGEKSVVIVSGTASDPATISANAEFLLDLNRSNVAFSRARDRMIVVCARTLLDHVPADLDHYESALLWKYLRAMCTRRVASERVAGVGVEVFTLPTAIGADA